MFRSLLLPILIVGLVGYGIYEFFQTPREASEVASLSSPEVQFEQLLSSTLVPAEHLSRLCNRYPQLATQLLRNRSMRVAGTVEDLFVTGLDGRRAIVTLCRNERRKLVAVLDMNQYAVLGLSPLADRRIRYLLVGNELLKVTPEGTYRHGAHRTEVHEEVRTTVFTRSLPFEETVTFDRISPEAIILKAAAK